MPELEGSDHENEQSNRRTASTPFENPVSKEEFDILTGRVNDLFDKFYQGRSDSEADTDSIVQMQRKLENLETVLIPDLKIRIKTVKKSVPADANLPRSNKEVLEQVRSGLERARAKIAVLEQQKQDQKFKLSESSIGTLFGKYHNVH